MTAERTSSQAGLASIRAGIPYQQYPLRDEYADHIAAIDTAAREMSRRIVADREAALVWRLSVAQVLELTDRDRRVAGLGYTVPDGVPISGDHRPVWARG